MLEQKFMENGPGNILIAYGSQTGTAKLKAENAAQALSHAGVHAEAIGLNKLTPEILAAARRMLFVVSTYGNGEPPDMVRGFYYRAMASTAPAMDLAHIRYGMLALGDAGYPDFCGFGGKVERWLTRSGAAPMFETIRMDRVSPAAEALWQEQLHSLGAGDGTRGQQDLPFSEWKLVSREELNPGSPYLKAYHLRFEPVGEHDGEWEAGDIAEIQPSNATQEIEVLLSGLEHEGELATTLRASLANLELPEAGVALTAERVAALPTLPLREYSAASIPADGTLDLVVRQVKRDDGRFGIGSGWLTAHMQQGETLMLRLRSNLAFRAAVDGTPLILIGNGTGIAGLRAHLRQQAHDGGKGHWLLFGERQQTHEAFFDAELQGWLADGTLARLDRSWSRDGESTRYVQHLLEEHRDAVTEWIARGAAVLVCGSLEGMAQEVHAALAGIVGEDRIEQLAEAGRYKRDVY